MELHPTDEQGNTQQTIQCCGSDSQISFPIYGTDVNIKASELNTTDSNTASNKIKVSQISKFEWVEKYYLGNLVSCNSTYIAYVIRAKSNMDDHVRVLNHHTSERVLLRGFKKNVVDVCFESFKSCKLACVDSEGTLHVFDIVETDETDGKLSSNVLLQVQRTEKLSEKSYRVTWAPNLLLPMEGHEPMVALSYGSKAEVFNLHIIQKKHTDKTLFTIDELKHGVIKVDECHDKDITSLSLSPDTQVLATGSFDGTVKFWSLDFDSENYEPSCLHEWEPHDGSPVTCLFFCDNLLVGDDTSPFWRYLVTGTAQNSILKIWCAVKWECIQTIRFDDYIDGSSITNSPCLKIALDISAKYLVLSDIYRQVLYIFQLHHDVEKDKSSIISVSEFILKDPLLSFSICVAKERKPRSSSDDGDADGMFNGVEADPDESIDREAQEGTANISIISLFAIQRRALSKYSIKFKPVSSIGAIPPSVSTASQDDLSIRDALSDIDSTCTSEKLLSHRSQSVSDDETFSVKSHQSANSSLTAVSVLPLSPTTPDATLEALSPTSSNSTSDDGQKEQTLIDFTVPSVADKIVTPGEIPNTNESFVTRMEQLNVETSMQESNDTDAEDGLPSAAEIAESVMTPMNVGLLPQPPSDEKPNSVTDDDFPTDFKPSPEISPAGMSQVLAILSKQQALINNQQQELVEMKEMLKMLVRKQTQQPSTTASVIPNTVNEVAETEREDMKVHMQLLQKSAASQFNKASKEFSKQCNQRLDQLTKDMYATVQTKEDRIVQLLSNVVSNTIAIKLEKTIKTEMKQTVLTHLEKIQVKYFENLTNQVAQKISVWERTLREECRELVKSKPVADAIAYSAASILEGTIPNSYKESFQKVLLPGFEKASMTMFMQINDTFQQGTKQYLQRLEGHLDSKRQKQQDQQDPLISNLQDLVNSFQGTADRLTSGVETNLEALMQKQLRDATDRMQTSFGKTVEARIMPSISSCITKCTDDAFNDWKTKIDDSINQIVQNSTVSSAISSGEDLDAKKARVMTHVKNGEFNTAFEIALTASDLSLVMYLCKQIDPCDLFSLPEKLPQPIILSLIQQLSINMFEDTEIRTKYLEESMLVLDTRNDITREHLPSILQSLNDQLNITIEGMLRNDASNKQVKPLKMLLLASKSLLHGD